MRLSLLVLLAGCPGSPDSDADPDSDTEADSDTDTDPTANPFAGVAFDTDWDGTGITLTVSNGSGRYLFGMAGTGEGIGGWFGENCAGGEAGYDYCHGLSPPGLTLTTVDTPDAVVEGVSTLFRAAEASDITYIVIASSGDCLVWGHDPSYYDGLDCQESP